MDSAATLRASFDPPPPGGKGRAFVLALLVHALLVLALAWGVRWKKDAQDQAVDVELWSVTAQIAAPRAARQPPPPPPPPEPAPPPRATPVPQPRPVVQPPPVDNSVRDAQLALERQKEREEAQRKADAKRQEAQQRKQRQQAQAKADAEEAAAKAEAAKKAAAEKAAQQKVAAEQKAKADAQAKADKAAAAKKVADQQKAKADAAEKNRQAELRRLTALAGADTAGSTANGTGKTPGGTASRDAGPSAGYGSKVRGKVFPNITFPDMSNIRGNPSAEVEVRASPDGTIIDRTLTRSSGVPSWDAAVLRAIDKTETLPRDIDGRVPSPIIITFQPQSR